MSLRQLQLSRDPEICRTADGPPGLTHTHMHTQHTHTLYVSWNLNWCALKQHLAACCWDQMRVWKDDISCSWYTNTFSPHFVATLTLWCLLGSCPNPADLSSYWLSPVFPKNNCKADGWKYSAVILVNPTNILIPCGNNPTLPLTGQHG